MAEERMLITGGQRLEGTGVTVAHPGGEVLVLEGETFRLDGESLRLLPGVRAVQRLTEPYPLAARTGHPEDTVVSVGKARIGQDFCLIAGPCAVESPEQVTSITRQVSAAGAQLLRGGVFKPRTYTLSDGTVVKEKRSRAPIIILIVVALAAVSVRVTGFDFAVLVKRGSKFFDILKAMFPPNTAYLSKIWTPLWDTIKMSFLGSFIGAVLAIPFAIAAASNIVTNRVVVFIVRLFLSLVRTLPTLVCALIATYIFGLGTMAGTCAIAVFTFAYVGKQLFEIIETVDMGPYEAMEALGATRLQAFTTAVFPQVLPTYLSVSLFCLEGNVRYASILGYVGAGGLGLIMNEKIGWREYDSLGMILIVLFVTVIVIEALSHWLRKRLT